jgi:hypothetical protein
MVRLAFAEERLLMSRLHSYSARPRSVPRRLAAEVAAVNEFNLSDEQRKRLVVQERD